MRSLGRKALGLLAAAAVMMGSWDIVARIVDSPALPGPVAAFVEFGRLFSSVLVPQTAISAGRVLVSLAIAVVVAAPLGLVTGRSPRLDAAFAPLIFLSYPIPKIVALPVLFVLLGTGNLSKISLITLIVSFQVLITARDAARAIPASSVQSVRSLGAGGLGVFRHVVVPATLPAIFTALRLSAGHAIAALFFAETVAGTSGLGYVIIDAWARIQYAEMFAAVLAMALLGVTLYELLEIAEGRLCRWTKVQTQATRADQG